MRMSTETLTIGRLANAADVNIDTIRYYQHVGLIVRQPDGTEKTVSADHRILIATGARQSKRQDRSRRRD